MLFLLDPKLLGIVLLGDREDCGERTGVDDVDDGDDDGVGNCIEKDLG